MTEWDQLARPLGGHDAGHLGAGERVSLGQLPQALDRGRRHAHRRRGGRPPVLHRLAAHVDHVDASGLVEMREAVVHQGVVHFDNGPAALAATTAVTGRV